MKRSAWPASVATSSARSKSALPGVPGRSSATHSREDAPAGVVGVEQHRDRRGARRTCASDPRRSPRTSPETSMTTASPSRSGLRDGPRPWAAESPGPCSGVSVGPGTAPLSPASTWPKKNSAVDAAEADRALVPAQRACGARARSARRTPDRPGTSTCGAYSIAPWLCSQAARMRVDLPLALARARRPQRRHAVEQLGARQQRLVAEVGRRRQHVELDSEAQALGQADRRERRRAGRAAT